METSLDVGSLSPASDTPIDPPRRVWTVFLAYSALLVGTILAAVAIYGVLILTDPELVHQPEGLLVALVKEAQSSTIVRLLRAVVMVGIEVTIALMAARLSRESVQSRLALGSSRLHPGAILIASVGLVAVSSLLNGVRSLFHVQSTGLDRLNRLVADLSPSAFFVMAAIVGVLGPLAEELFFRGYVQTRLCRRWGTWGGICATSALFGIIHVDRVQVMAAFFMGLYLGWLAQRSRSIRPGIAAHVAVNLTWVFGKLGTRPPSGSHLSPLGATVLVAIAAGTIFWLHTRFERASRTEMPPALP